MTTTPAFDLAPRQTLRLRRTGALQLQVLRGRLWVTRSHDCADHFVAAGQTLHLAAGDDVVIECDSPQPSRLRLLASATPRAPRAVAPAAAPQWPAWPPRPRP